MAAIPDQASTVAEEELEHSKPADLSLTIAEYEELGIPSCRRLWNSGDMAKAARVLADIAENDAAKLPRLDSPRSGKVFARITSDDNLDQVRAGSLPKAIRMGFGLQFMQAAISIKKTYSSGLRQEKTGGEEVAGLVGLNLRIAVALSRLVDEFASTLDKNDPALAQRLSGLKEMKSGMSTILLGALSQATESKALDSTARRSLLKSFDETLPVLIRSIPPSIRKDAVAQLKELSEKPEYAQHKMLMDSLLDKLAKAIEESTDE
jgi:hypothetical protein